MNSATSETLEISLQKFRQGDVLTLASGVWPTAAGDSDSDTEVQVAIISQSCDIVRRERQHVVVAALTELPPESAGLATRGSIPRYVSLPALKSAAFIDLDRIATVPKSTLAGRAHEPGVDPEDWGQVRNLSRSIGRKFSRFAFPDEVVPWFDPLRSVVEKRHQKNSALGRVLRAITELRVEADEWSQAGRRVKLHVIVAADQIPEPTDAEPSADVLSLDSSNIRSLETVAALLRPDNDKVRGGTDGVFLWDLVSQCLVNRCVTNVDHSKVSGSESAISELEGITWSETDFSLAQYRVSEMLDLDHLSSARFGS